MNTAAAPQHQPEELSINDIHRPDASTTRRRRGRWITAGAAVAATSLLATLFPARVEAVAPELPAILAEPSAWGLPALPGTSGNTPLLDLDRHGDVCQPGEDDMCVVRSTTPTFGSGTVEPHPDHGWEYVLFDLGAEQARGDASGPTTEDRWTPAPGSMVDGGTYVVAVSPADPDGELADAIEDGEIEDPTETMLVIVDRRGDALQEWQYAGPFAVAPTTGELVMHAPLGTSEVSIPLTLTYRSSNLTTPAIGPFRAPLGGGWEISLPAPPTWFEIVEYGATGTLELVGTNGQRLRFLDNGDGTYDLPQLVETDVTGVRAILTADESTGGWRLVDTDGAVYEFSYWGDLERYTPALSEDIGAATYETTWFDGSLTAVTDPVTGRSVELGYLGGPTGCPATPDGFDRAPLGALCSITFIDDPDSDDATVTVNVGWRGDDVAALFLPEGRRLDVGYDSAATMTSLRDPRAALVAAVSGDSGDLTYDLDYDASGRIETITGPAATAGSESRETLRFGYTDGQTTIASELTGGQPQVTTVAYDPNTWVTQSVTDPLGVAAVALYDADDRPLGLRQGNLQTVYERADDGRSVTIWGPAPVSVFDASTHLPLAAHRDDIPMTREIVDSTTDSQGWVATWWNTTNRAGSTVANTIVSGAIGAPGNVTDGWSAELMTTVDRNPDVAGYIVTVDGATLEEVTVDGEEVDETGLPVLDDAEPGEGPVLITALVSGETAPGSASPLTVAVTAVDEQGTHLFTLDAGDLVAPLQLPSERYTRDWATGTAALVHEVIRYDDPFSERPSSVVTTYADGSTETTTASFEGFSTDFSELWRPLTETAPSGTTTTNEHWGARERTTPPGYDRSQLQGGMPRAQHLPDAGGTSGTERTWWTSRGQLAATETAATGTTTTHHYDGIGRHTSTTVSAGVAPGTGNGSAMSLDVEYGITATGLFVETHTSATAATGTTTIVVYRDLHDRVVHLVDPHGVRTDTTYGDDVIVDDTYLATGVLAQSVTTTFTADGTRPTSIVTDGIDGGTHRLDIGYDAANPWYVATVVDSGGFTTTYGFDGYGMRNRLDVTDAAGVTWTETAAYTPDGRITSRTQTADGAAQATQRFAYHADGTAATFTFDGPDGTTEVATSFEQLPAELAGPNPTAPADRTPSQIVTTGPDGAVETLTIGYDQWAAPAVVTRDGESVMIAGEAGAIIRFDQTDLSYDQLRDVIAVDDGTNRYEYRRDAAGDVLTSVSTIDGTTTTYHHTASGLVLAPDQQPVSASLPSIGAVDHTLSPAGSSSVAIVGLDGNVWATVDPEAPTLDSATPMWFTPYGMPIQTDVQTDSAPDGDSAAVDGHSSGWKSLPTTDTVNPVVITPFRAMLPEIGSFTTPDPVQAGSTLFNYTDGDPFNQEDRTGLSPYDASRMFRNIGGLTSIVLAITSFFFPKKFLAFALLDVALNAAMWTLMFAAGDLDDGALIAAIAFSVISLVPLIPSGIRAYRHSARTIHVRPPSNSISSSTSPTSYSPAMRNPSPSPPPPNVATSPPPTVTPTRTSVATNPPLSRHNVTQLPTIREGTVQSSSAIAQSPMGAMTRDQARAFHNEQHRLVVNGLRTGGLL